VAALFDEVVAALAGGVPRFQWLPSGLRRDPDAAWRHGVADCVACALRLERELARLGFEARTALGHVLGLVPSEHAWVEVRDADGAWKALDPVLAALGGREPGTDPEFAAFCLGSVCNRLLPWDRTAAEPLAVHACAAPAAGVETTVLSGMAR
jgi:hypothetical protein